MTTIAFAAFDLPWPPKELRANARSHWRPKAAATKLQRHTAAWITIINTKPEDRSMAALSSKLAVSLEFIPPDRQKRDPSNMLHSAKALLDGIQDALGLDDRHFVVTHSLAAEPMKHGAVRVKLGLITAESPKEG